MSLRLDENFTALLSQIRNLLPSEKVFLVGGAVRDLLLGKPVHDLDFVLAKDSVRLAKAVKNYFRGVWYTLDDERQTARVILQQGSNEELVLDFTSFIGDTLEEDLSQRDYTINAMAIDLDNPNEIIDPLGGRIDLLEKRLKPGSPNSLRSDPLRVLRGVRMERMYELEASSETIEKMRVATKGLGQVSGERIRDELLKCLNLPDREKTFCLLDRHGIYSYLVLRANGLDAGSGFHDPISNSYLNLIESECVHTHEHLITDDFIEKRSEIIKNFDSILVGIQNNNLPKQFEAVSQQVKDPESFIKNLKETINEELQGSRTRTDSILLTVFLARSFDDLDFAGNLTSFLLLGQKEKKAIEKICSGYRNITTLSLLNELTHLEIYRLFRDSGTFTIESALLHLCQEQVENQKKSKVALKVLESWFEDQESVIDPPRLIDGDQLQKELGISPGPRMGEYLESIREAQVTGEVERYQDAINLVKRLIEDRSRNENKG